MLQTMKVRRQHFSVLIMFAMIVSAGAQSPSTLAGAPDAQSESTPGDSAYSSTSIPPAGVVMPGIEQLLAFKNSDVKFDIHHLMGLLRDRRHEGWVLTAYPDPNTSQPLIGAGFTLDLPARAHPQHDPMNPHPFVEPSSAELWRAAGLDSERLQKILAQYNTRLATWTKRKFRNKLRTLSPQITEEEATLLLRISAIQSIYNAKAYCRNFDQLTASQQMALSQLVYQMGVNLEEFTQFLGLINNSSTNALADAPSQSSATTGNEYWSDVQKALIQSKWARLYRARAVSVIAMLDPHYPENPRIAEQYVAATLHPAIIRRHRAAASTKLASVSGHGHPGRPYGRGANHARKKRRA